MGTYEELKQAISAVIKENNNQEITGEIMQSVLLSIINNIGANATFAGIANTRTAPSQADANVFYIATEPGIYPNFGGITIRDEVAILKNSSGRWEVETFGAATKSSVDILSTTISNEITRAKNAESTLSQSINTEKQNITQNTNNIANIKNTVVKSNVSSNEAFNNVVKELYFDKWFNLSEIKKVAIGRKIDRGGYYVWEMYFVSQDDLWSYAMFTSDSTAEYDDVNVGTIIASDTAHPAHDKEIKVYAVINWSALQENRQTSFDSVNLSYNTTNVKYQPTINHCVGTHKYSHAIKAIKAIKELYIEDLKKNNVAVSKKDFEECFVVQSIACNVIDGVKRNYQIAIADTREKNKYGNGDKSEYIYAAHYTYSDENAVFYLDKVTIPSKPQVDGVETGNVYSYKLYAVIDWSVMEESTSGGYYYSTESHMLAGCLDKKNSPIIYNYIEINKLRTELNLRPINEE